MKKAMETPASTTCTCTTNDRANSIHRAAFAGASLPRHCKKTSGIISYFNFGTLCFLAVFLLILSDIHPAECRRISSRRKSKDTQAAMDGEASRQHAKPKGKILKTVEKARHITEKKYLKSDWCKSRPLKQVVRSRNGCKGVFVNHFCYGQCNSFYIPRDLTPDMTEPLYFKSCSFCKPFREERISVTLTCSRNRGKRNRVIKRMVNKIKECRCIAVPDVGTSSAPESPASSPSASSSTSLVSTMTSSDTAISR